MAFQDVRDVGSREKGRGFWKEDSWKAKETDGGCDVYIAVHVSPMGRGSNGAAQGRAI